MSTIVLITRIKASVSDCFDTARSVELHLDSMEHTGEKVVAGRLSGLCELNDQVTWEAKHLGFTQQLTVRITKMDKPYFFEDCMLKGAFASMRHEHHFTEESGITTMKDVFYFESPLGILGRLVNFFFLKGYMTRLLIQRNEAIRKQVEG